MWRSMLLVGALFAGVAHADDAPAAYQVPEFLSQTPPLPPSLAGGDVLRLDLATALQIAAKQNLDLALERSAVRVAELNEIVAGQAFEPLLAAGYNHTNTQTPAQNTNQGQAGQTITDRNDSWSVSLQERFTTATAVDVAWTNGRDKSNFLNAIEPLNYRSTLSVRATQSVARGFSTDLDVPRAPLVSAHIASARERQQLAIALADLVERTELAYWSVLQSLYTYDLAVRSTKLADDQMALTRRQIEAGMTPPSDLISAESALAGKKLELVQSEAAVSAAMDQLRTVMNLPHAEWSRPILPTDVPKYAPAKASADDAFAAATKQRPELAQLALDVQAAELAIKVADNNVLPQLDVGVEGDLTGQDPSYGSTLGQLSSADSPSWSVFVSFSWTPLARATRAAAEIAKVRLQMTQASKQQLVQKVWADVRDAVRRQDNAQRSLFAAAHFRDLADQALALEQKKFLNNQTTNLAVSQRQDALASARASELNALLEVERTATSVLKSTGALLAARNITLQ